MTNSDHQLNPYCSTTADTTERRSKWSLVDGTVFIVSVYGITHFAVSLCLVAVLVLLRPTHVDALGATLRVVWVCSVACFFLGLFSWLIFRRGHCRSVRLLYATLSISGAIVVCTLDRFLYGFDYVILSDGVRDGTNFLTWWL